MKKRLLNIVTIGMIGMGLSACQMGGGAPAAPSLGPVAQAIARGEDHVAVKDLASWIVQGRKDFMLGVRLSAERFGIKLAESIEVAQRLMSEDRIDFLDMSLWDVFKEPEPN